MLICLSVRLLLVCSGPANDVGDDESILVHVGPDVILDAVDISFEGDGGLLSALGQCRVPFENL